MSHGHYNWSRQPRTDSAITLLRWQSDRLPRETFLPYGNGRSYSDVCLNDGHTLLDCKPLDHLIAFDRDTGIVEVEAGTLLSDLLAVIVPAGWFLPVTPGTRFVTIGGAIANDVHGKNHQHAGSFGCHLLSLELQRSDGTRLSCSATENEDWLAATIGGLGLTGVIVRATLQLIPIGSARLDVSHRPFRSFAEFLELSDSSNAQYTVAWLDTTPAGSDLRGIFSAGDFCDDGDFSPADPRSRDLPFLQPFSLLNRISVPLLNRLWFERNRKPRQRAEHYQQFFYPLDGIGNWNRAYGRHGFLQYQFVVPEAAAEDLIREFLEQTKRLGAVSFISVLKKFGDRPSPGLLSFPRSGITLAVDFNLPNPGLLKYLTDFDQRLVAAGGATYPAKDGRLEGKTFREFFPAWQEFLRYRDSGINSDFWRRIEPALLKGSNT